MDRWFLCALLAVLFGCGGSVVIDEAATGTSGGGTGSTSTATTGTASASSAVSTSSSASGTSCAELETSFTRLIPEATACNACMDDNRCKGIVIHDPCGCPMGSNDTQPELAQQAEAIYQQWVAAG